jgi:hypothetical protein
MSCHVSVRQLTCERSSSPRRCQRHRPYDAPAFTHPLQARAAPAWLLRANKRLSRPSIDSQSPVSTWRFQQGLTTPPSSRAMSNTIAWGGKLQFARRCGQHGPFGTGPIRLTRMHCLDSAHDPALISDGKHSSPTLGLRRVARSIRTGRWPGPFWSSHADPHLRGTEWPEG